jgi:hypothetical protein
VLDVVRCAVRSCVNSWHWQRCQSLSSVRYVECVLYRYCRSIFVVCVLFCPSRRSLIYLFAQRFSVVVCASRRAKRLFQFELSELCRCPRFVKGDSLTVLNFVCFIASFVYFIVSGQVCGLAVQLVGTALFLLIMCCCAV